MNLFLIPDSEGSGIQVPEGKNTCTDPLCIPPVSPYRVRNRSRGVECSCFPETGGNRRGIPP